MTQGPVAQPGGGCQILPKFLLEKVCLGTTIRCNNVISDWPRGARGAQCLERSSCCGAGGMSIPEQAARAGRTQQHIPVPNKCFSSQDKTPALHSGPVGTAELRAWAVPWALLPELGFAILSWDSWRASQGQNLRRHLHFSPDFPS